MSPKPLVAALEGWFTLDPDKPSLLGSRCTACGTCYFPRQTLFCRNPACESTIFEDIPLSRRGRIWSYTNACFKPPEPFVADDPYEAFTIAAVELEAERMVVLGQVVKGVSVSELRVGQEVELVLETLSSDDASDQLIWKWKPAS